MRSFARRHTLAFIATFHVVLSIYTSLAVPLWESFDATGHIAYARYIGQTGRLPPLGTELDRYSESHQPPLYYLLPAIPFALIDTPETVRPKWTAHGKTITVFDPDVEAMPWRGTILAIRLARLLSIIPGTLCVILTWRTARILFPNDPSMAPIAALIHAVWPNLVFLNGVVTNDIGMALMGSLVLWQIVGLVRKPRQWRWWLGLAATAVASLLTKDNGVVLLAAAVSALVLVLARELARKHAQAILKFCAAAISIAVLTTMSVPLSGGRTLRPIEAAVSFLVSTTQLVAPAQTRSVGPGNAGPVAAWLEVSQRVDWLDAWTSTIGRYSWGVLLPPESWHAMALQALFGVAVSLAVCFVFGPGRREILLLLAAVGTSVIPTIARGQPLLVTGRFFLPALGAITILIALTITRWRTRVVSRIWGIALVSGLSLWSLLAPVVVLRPAYQGPTLLDPVALPADMQIRSTLVFGDAVELLGYSQPKPLTSVGDKARIILYWRVRKPIARDHGVRVELLSTGGPALKAYWKEYWQGTPGNNNYPTSAWTEGATFAETIDIPIRPHPSLPTTAVFKIYWFDQEHPEIFLPATCESVSPDGVPRRVPCDARVGMIRIASAKASPLDALAARFAAPPAAGFGDTIGLTQFAVPGPTTPGSVASIEVQWRGLAPIGTDYVSFAHVLDQRGKLVAQQDNQPRLGTYPTSAWRVNEVVDDTLDVQLPPDLEPGDYTVAIGWYEAMSLVRLPATSEARFPVRDGLVALGALRVTPAQP